MGMVLEYRQLSIDRAFVRFDSPQTFFDVGPYVDGSTPVVDLTEQRLLQWLMLFEPARQILFGELRFPSSAFYQPEVIRPFYSPGEGDIDLVICHWHAPHKAAAIECKRVKITVIDSERHQLNKLEDTQKGVQQANRLHNKFGFFQTYLMVLTVVEASRQDNSNIPCRGIDPEVSPIYGGATTFKRIVEFPGREDLNPEIGIVFFEVVQPSRLSIDTRVTLRICVHHPAQPRTQTDGETNRIVELIQTQEARLASF